MLSAHIQNSHSWQLDYVETRRLSCPTWRRRWWWKHDVYSRNTKKGFSPSHFSFDYKTVAKHPSLFIINHYLSVTLPLAELFLFWNVKDYGTSSLWSLPKMTLSGFTYTWKKAGVSELGRPNCLWFCTLHAGGTSWAKNPILAWRNTQNKSPRWPAEKSSPLRTSPQPQYILGARLPLPHTLQNSVKLGGRPAVFICLFCQRSLSWTIKIDGQPRWVYTTIPARETLNQSIGENINVLIKRLNYSHQPLVLSRTLIPFLTSEQLLFSNLRDTQQVLSVSGVLKHSAQRVGGLV